MSIVSDAKPQVRPWVRFWARYLDMLVWGFLLGTVLEWLEADVSGWRNYAFAILFLMLWIPMEALLLSTLGSTPGKMLFGVSVKTVEGLKLTYPYALKRSALVWWRGIGAGLPIVTFVTNLNGYQNLKHDLKQTTWDKDLQLAVTHRRTVLWSEILIYFLGAALAFNRWFAWLLDYA